MMVTGTISLLILNLTLKNFLSEIEYGQYSIFITYISLLSSFGLLGADQVFLRTVSYEKGILIVSKGFLKIILIIGLLSSLFSTLVIKSIYLSTIPYLSLFFISYSTIWILSFYNIFRIRSKFFVSQFINNIWKIILLIILFIIYKVSQPMVDLQLIVSVFLISTIITIFICGFLIIKNPIKLQGQKLQKSTILKLSAGFFLSLLIISFLNLGERFLIEYNIGLAELGNYFFLATFFLFPFSFMQGYIGFKELIHFKNTFTIHILHRKVLNSIVYGVILGFTLLLGSYALDYSNVYNLNIKGNLSVIITLIFLGILRLCYSIFSAAIGAVIGENHIISLNLISLCFILLIASLFFMINLSLIQLLLLFSASWVFRIFIFYYFLVRGSNKI